MDKQSILDMPTEYWYGKDGTIDHWFWGVFEGGGAKGVAYSGALLAMAEKKCWFRGVAGASAGAITAALVASGLSPEGDEMERETESALKHVQTGVWTGLRRLQKTTGYFPSDGLRDLLNDLLARQVEVKTKVKPNAPVTFEELYDATLIELNVVAANLSLRREMIFSKYETPKCAVADAVVASSSIPFAFTSQLLRAGEVKNGNRVSHHTIVDGGVWSNFPMYIFEDKSFRRFYERFPEEIASQQVLGFLLEESNEQAPLCGEDVQFVKSISLNEFRPVEWNRVKHSTVDKPSGYGSKIGALLLYPLYLLGRFVEWNSGIERGRWPSPRSKLANFLVHSVNGLLGGIHTLLFGLLACAIVGIGAWKVGGYIVADQLDSIAAKNWTDYFEYLSLFISLIFSSLGIAIVILVIFVTILGVFANRILLRALRRILYGLITTYVSGSGAPEWIAKKENIVALPVQSSVNTLSFDMSPEQKRDLIASARQATRRKLSKLLKIGPKVA